MTKETLRSTLLPKDQLGGTRLFVVFDGSWYRVETRYQDIYKTKSLDKALYKFENIVSGDEI